MINKIESVDLFIQDLFNGDITIKKQGEGTQIKDMKGFAEHIKEGITEYLKAKDEGKEEIIKEWAENIFAVIIHYRITGVVQNNPNSLRSLKTENDTLKTRITYLKRELEQHKMDNAILAKELKQTKEESEQRKIAERKSGVTGFSGV